MHIAEWLQQQTEYQPVAKPIARNIWRLTHRTNGQAHRLKIAQDAKASYFLQQESRWLSRINDTRFGRSIRLFQWQGFYCLLSDYLPGKTLTELIRSGHFQDQKQLDHTWQQCETIIRQLHGKQIVHADIKPNNMLLNNGEVTLIDFANAGWIGRSMQTRQYHAFSEHFSHPLLTQSKGQYQPEFDWFSLRCVIDACRLECLS